MPGVSRKTYELKDLQLVQSFEDKVNDLIMILEANNDNMQSLSAFYSNLMKNDDLDPVFRNGCAEDVREFAAQIADMMYDANMQIRRAKLLVKLTADRKALVCYSLPDMFSCDADANSDSSTSSRSSHRSDFELDIHVIQGSHHHAHHHSCHNHLPARYFCFGESVHYSV
mgnify:CR=1 FL=1